MKKIDTEEFIRRAREKHGDKFDYSKSVYVNNSTDLEIYCTVCDNTFYSTPANHNHKTKTGGCPYCSGKIRTTESVIKQCKKIHGDKYIYDHIDYKGTKIKVKVECKKHEMFEITPSNLTHAKRPRGCPRCAKVLNKEDFIEKAREVHGNKYSYDNLVFTSTRKKMTITCQDHSDFLQTGNGHLSGNGCEECAKISRADSRRSNTEEFIKKAKEIHGNKYDYSKVKYYDTYTKVKIICKRHGIFEKSPNSHLSGRGCLKCSFSKGERSIERFLNKNNIDYNMQYRFDDCRNIKPLSFDFYLPFYNTCIEFDGEQHYRPIKYFGGQKKFSDLKKRDKIKNEYCLINNIKLIRVSYTEFKRIDKILKRELKING